MVHRIREEAVTESVKRETIDMERDLPPHTDKGEEEGGDGGDDIEPTRDGAAASAAVRMHGRMAKFSKFCSVLRPDCAHRSRRKRRRGGLTNGTNSGM